MADSFARGADAPPRTVRVWDPVVRLFHWTVVTACLLNLFILRPGKTYHRYVGYVVIAALVIRIVWGFVGTHYARFSEFFPTPGRLLPYLRDLLKGQEPRHLGHNPAAAVMMFALMVLLAGTAGTGWMSTLDAFWGEEWLEELHEAFANAIMVLAFVHAAAAIVESWRQRENLVWSMVTGRKRV
ncbi:cytochrome b/b6 domain-containing protein [Oryzibacter oryziterrae]|uniref:cytochrome b/b6 domain-containing protein n=1 Tax=Oryzibacter oryziterrae TaxID=2766474 RepID=UPI001F01889C|nr:cytochrome b/b6 domain-containing protein [Oryzibacter oryziterrae]